jgi:hypothetical protein
MSWPGRYLCALRLEDVDVSMGSVESFAVALSAVIATFTFVVQYIESRRRRRDEDVRRWQKTVVHAVFQQSKEQWIAFDDLMTKYRSKSVDFSKHKLRDEELSVEGMRSILLELVSDRVVDQREGDVYSLLTINRQESDPAFQQLKDLFGTMTGFGRDLNSGADNLASIIENRVENEHQIIDLVINEVDNSPNRYTKSDLILRLQREIAAPDEHIRAVIARQVALGIIAEDDRGRLALAKRTF